MPCGVAGDDDDDDDDDDGNDDGDDDDADDIDDDVDAHDNEDFNAQLRYLQTLNSISAENNSTIIFPVPIDLMSHFVNNRQVCVCHCLLLFVIVCYC